MGPIWPIFKPHARLWRDYATFLPQLRATSPRRKSHEQMAVWRKLPNRGAWPIVPGKSSPEVTFWLQKPADTGALWWGGSLVQCSERAVKLYRICMLDLGRHDTSLFNYYTPLTIANWPLRVFRESNKLHPVQLLLQYLSFTHLLYSVSQCQYKASAITQ